MFKPKKLSFEELSRRLRQYEERFGCSTIEFYKRYQDGELGDDPDMMLWAGTYHLYLTSLPVRQLMQKAPAIA
jgi:hypothetical protein